MSLCFDDSPIDDAAIQTIKEHDDNKRNEKFNIGDKVKIINPFSVLYFGCEGEVVGIDKRWSNQKYLVQMPEVIEGYCGPQLFSFLSLEKISD